jgi:hypothetical protein
VLHLSLGMPMPLVRRGNPFTPWGAMNHAVKQCRYQETPQTLERQQQA